MLSLYLDLSPTLWIIYLFSLSGKKELGTLVALSDRGVL